MNTTVLTSTLEFVMISIAVVVGIILLIISFTYLLGNVYNGLVRRREKVKNSMRELWKLLNKYYDILPTFIKFSKNDKDRERLKELIRSQSNLKKEDMLGQGEVFFQIRDIVLAIQKNDLDQNESADFLNEYDRLIKFSIPLYNANVNDYNHFRHLFFNRVMACVFHFNEAYCFLSKEEAISIMVKKNKKEK